MASSAPTPSVIRFGAFELEAATGELRKGGISLKIHPQPFRVLMLLAERPGRIVTRDEIQHCLWGDGTFVDYERGINFCINQIRGALGDDADSPRYIETLPRRGYRFIASVSLSAAKHTIPIRQVSVRDDLLHVATGNGEGLTSTDDKLTSVPQNSKALQLYVLLGTALAISLLAAGLVWRLFRHQNSAPSATLSERQLTHNPPENRNLGGAISPDGKHVAYLDVRGLHLLIIDTGELHDIPLPDDVVSKVWVVQWFADGENLLLRTGMAAEGNVLWRTSVFGGTPRRLRSEAWPAATSPESATIAFISGQSKEMWVMDSSGENLKKILTSEDRLNNVAWSPTGRRLAYIRNFGADGNQRKPSIETVSLDGGPSNVVLSDVHLGKEVLFWTHDGRLIFSRNEPRQIDAANLWQVAADPKTGNVSGQAARITNWYGVNPSDLSVSRDGKRLFVAKFQNRNDVCIGDLKEMGTRLDAVRRLTFSESRDVPSAWTSDSKTVLFFSNRTGRRQIFVQEIGKDVAEPLVSGLDEQTGAEPTPDGRWILYYSSEYSEGDSPPMTRLMRFATSGRISEQVLRVQGVPGLSTVLFDCPTHPSGSCVISRLDQGRLVFYALDPMQGQGREVARTKFEHNNVEGWVISPDGLRIAVLNVNQQGRQISILELENGAERDIPLSPALRVYGLVWTADGKGFFATVAAPHYQILRIGLDGKTSVLLDRARNTWLGDIIASADGLHLAFNQQTFETNDWLLENF